LEVRKCSSITLIIILCGCGTLCLALKEKCRLGLSEKSILRRVFEPEKQGMTKVQVKLNFWSS
jgi:hypothetical protein